MLAECIAAARKPLNSGRLAPPDFDPLAPRLARLYRASITGGGAPVVRPIAAGGSERRIINITGGSFNGGAAAAARCWKVARTGRWSVARRVAPSARFYAYRRRHLLCAHFGHGHPLVVARLFSGRPSSGHPLFPMTPIRTGVRVMPGSMPDPDWLGHAHAGPT